MPAFGGKIPDQQIWQIVAYVRSLSGQLPKDVRSTRNDHMSVHPSDQAHGHHSSQETRGASNDLLRLPRSRRCLLSSLAELLQLAVCSRSLQGHRLDISPRFGGSVLGVSGDLVTGRLRLLVRVASASRQATGARRALHDARRRERSDHRPWSLRAVGVDGRDSARLPGRERRHRPAHGADSCPIRRVDTSSVTGNQWWWKAEYLDADTADRVIDRQRDPHPGGSSGPASYAVSTDVIHSFWVPKLHGKKRSDPGHARTI